MEEYNRIIIPTDGSEENEKVVDEGLSLARMLGAKVKALFVIDTGSLSGLPPDDMITTLEGQIETKANEILDDIEERAENWGIDFERSMQKGPPSDIIVSAAKENDLIVMGHHKRSGLSRLITGSTAQKVIRKADCPVMIIRLEEDQS
ncbi:MAG: universal stress protein [Candidatus Thermoplasmatota archaeon]|nr:universal stress protein [Candidatus Thermoplasmatota archaeon]